MHERAERTTKIRYCIEVVRKIAAALRLASMDGPTAYALIHYQHRPHVGADIQLDAWLIGDLGVIKSAYGQTPEGDVPYPGLSPLLDSLGIATRSVRRGHERRGASGSQKQYHWNVEQSRSKLASIAEFLIPDGIARNLVESGSGRLIVLPHGDTGLAPFAALPMPVLSDADMGWYKASGRLPYLSDRWAITIAPDLESLSRAPISVGIETANLEGKALIIGDPELTGDTEWEWAPLPSARAEAATAAETLRGTGRIPIVLIGRDATRETVVAHLTDPSPLSLVYFATHGVADEENPADGGFLALKNGNLNGSALRMLVTPGLTDGHPLVVLSACQTALGKPFPGGTFGMARIWLEKGASGVVASLWNVSDSATYILMSRFMTWQRLGAPPDEALRRAQVEVAELYPEDPAAWASFVLIQGTQGWPGVSLGQLDSALPRGWPYRKANNP
jgi:CHAT domain-containing protein